MKFSGKVCFKIILKVTKNQGFTLSLDDTIFEKPQGEEEGGGVKLIPPSRFRVNTFCFQNNIDFLDLPFLPLLSPFYTLRGGDLSVYISILLNITDGEPANVLQNPSKLVNFV